MQLQTVRAQRGNHFHLYSCSSNTYIPYNTSPGSMHIPDLFCVIPPTLAVAVFIFHGKLYANTCSVELPAGGGGGGRTCYE